MAKTKQRLTEYELQVVANLPVGNCELVVDGGHFLKVVRDGITRATVSLDIMTADFKAMFVPKGIRGAESIVKVFRRLAERGLEIRILHAGTPSSAALVELRRELPAGLTIRRCPRLHAKAVVIDARMMYLGSANLTGRGPRSKRQRAAEFRNGCLDRSTSPHRRRARTIQSIVGRPTLRELRPQRNMSCPPRRASVGGCWGETLLIDADFELQ